MTAFFHELAAEDSDDDLRGIYAYRVLMTGIHLLRTGEVEANLLRLNEHFGFRFLDELIARYSRSANSPSARDARPPRQGSA